MTRERWGYAAVSLFKRDGKFCYIFWLGVWNRSSFSLLRKFILLSRRVALMSCRECICFLPGCPIICAASHLCQFLGEILWISMQKLCWKVCFTRTVVPGVRNLGRVWWFKCLLPSTGEKWSPVRGGGLSQAQHIWRAKEQNSSSDGLDTRLQQIHRSGTTTLQGQVLSSFIKLKTQL